jgi:hypothetical protein
MRSPSGPDGGFPSLTPIATTRVSAERGSDPESETSMGRAMLTQCQLRKLFHPLNQSLIPADDTAVMSTIELRPSVPTPVSSVEDLIARIADLVVERQSLRSNGGDGEGLERNRVELVSLHWQLSRALIERHCRPAA